MNLIKILRQEFSFITGNLKVLVFSWFLMFVALGMPQSNYQYFVESLGGDSTILGIIGFINFVCMAIVAIPGGFLADKYGRRWLISTLTFAIGLSHFIFAVAPSWEVIFVGQLVNSLCLIYQPALIAMVQDSMPPDRRGIASSISHFVRGIGNTLGSWIAFLIFLYIGKIPGMRFVYFIMIGLYIGSGILRLKLKETIPNEERIRIIYLVTSFREASKESWAVLKVASRTLIAIFVSRILVWLSWSFIEVINALYARDVLLLPEEVWWYIPIAQFLIAALTSLPVGMMIDRIGRKIPLVLGFALLSMSTMIFIVGNFVMVIVSMCLLGFSRILIWSSLLALLTDLVSQTKRGKIIGFNNFVVYLMSAFSMLLGGYIYGNLIPQSPLILSILMSTTALLIVSFMVNERKERKEVNEIS